MEIFWKNMVCWCHILCLVFTRSQFVMRFWLYKYGNYSVLLKPHKQSIVFTLKKNSADMCIIVISKQKSILFNWFTREKKKCGVTEWSFFYTYYPRYYLVWRESSFGSFGWMRHLWSIYFPNSSKISFIFSIFQSNLVRKAIGV
jgi:hypothetical protein